MLRATIMVMAVNLAGAGLNLAVTALLARLLGLDGFGAYTTLFTIATLVGILLVGGLPSVLIREAAFALHEDKTGRILGLLIFSATSICAMTLLIGPILHHWLEYAYSDLRISKHISFGILILALGLALSEAISGLLQGLHSVSLGRLVAVLRPLIMAIFLTAPFIHLVSGEAVNDFDYQDGIWLHTGAAAAAVGVLGYFLWRRLPARTFRSYPEMQWQQMMASSLPVLFSRLALTAHQAFPILLLTALSTVSESGIFRAAERTAFFASFGLTAVGMVMQPRLARSFRSGCPDELRALLRGSAWLVFLLTAPIVLFLIIFRKSILQILFGQDFTSASSVLLILAIGHALNAATGLTSSTLFMIKKEWVSAVAGWIGVGLAVTLCVWLIPTRGGVGAAIASASGLVASNILMLAYLQFAMRLPTTVFSIIPRT